MCEDLKSKVQSLAVADRCLLQPEETAQQIQDHPLVIYVLLESSDAANEDNFRYYLREGIRENDGCLHIILVDPQKVSFHRSASSTHL